MKNMDYVIQKTCSPRMGPILENVALPTPFLFESE